MTGRHTLGHPSQGGVRAGAGGPPGPGGVHLYALWLILKFCVDLGLQSINFVDLGFYYILWVCGAQESALRSWPRLYVTVCQYRRNAYLISGNMRFVFITFICIFLPTGQRCVRSWLEAVAFRCEWSFIIITI